MAENNSNNTGQEPGKTFTQEELDAIVQQRLAREREKYPDYDIMKKKAEKFDKIEEESKTELQKAQESANALKKELDALKTQNNIKDIRSKIASEMKVPESLLSGTDEETCTEQAKAILEFAKPTGDYPDVKDGGSPHIKQTNKTRDQFAEFMCNSLGIK